MSNVSKNKSSGCSMNCRSFFHKKKMITDVQKVFIFAT
uniref:Uncharacterized protein n=1 Tax=Arundo donax TaxID=35708 RepID=A0A0A8ZK67_ARUDO